MSKGSAPPPPQESEYNKTLARVSNDLYQDSKDYLPAAANYRAGVDRLNSDSAYAGAVAKGQQLAGANTGAAMAGGAASMAAGGGLGALINAAHAAYGANADAVYGGYTRQRGNFINAAKGVMDLGNGNIDGAMKGYQGVSDADTTRINSNYANDIGNSIAMQNATTANWKALAQMGSSYAMSGNGFGGSGSASTATSGQQGGFSTFDSADNGYMKSYGYNI